MKFACEHRFDGISLADYEKLYFDEGFNAALCQAVGLQRTPLKFEDQPERVHREVKVAPDRQIPGPVAKVLGGARIEYTEIVDYSKPSHRGTWKTVSSLLTDKVDAKGNLTFRAEGSGVVRVVDGEIKVGIFGLGGVVEKFIVEDVEKSYERAAEFTRKWIAEHR